MAPVLGRGEGGSGQAPARALTGPEGAVIAERRCPECNPFCRSLGSAAGARAAASGSPSPSRTGFGVAA